MRHNAFVTKARAVAKCITLKSDLYHSFSRPPSLKLKVLVAESVRGSITYLELRFAGVESYEDSENS